RWDPEWQNDDLHVAFWIQAIGGQTVEQVADRVGRHFRGFEPIVDEATERLLRNGRPTEHFGVAEGIGEPWIERIPGATEAQRKGGGKLRPSGKWRPIALGEFVLGQFDETADVFPVPDPKEVFNGGTYMVVRKLEQDVAAFQHFVAEGAG